MPYCHECGTKIAGGVSFCPECGTSLSDGRESSGKESGGTPAREPGPAADTGDTGAHEAASATGDAAASDATTRDQSFGAGSSLAGRFWVTTLVGSVPAFVLGVILASFTGGVLYFVGVIGGTFAGGLLYRRGTGGGAKVGAVSGFLSTIPFAALLFGVLAIGLSGLIANTPLATEAPQAGGACSPHTESSRW